MGSIENVKNTTYVLIAESGNDFQQCIGVCNNRSKAFGIAYLWLDDLMNGALTVGKDDGVSISPVYPLGNDGDTGWGMKLVGDDDILERVHILIYDGPAEVD